MKSPEFRAAASDMHMLLLVNPSDQIPQGHQFWHPQCGAEEDRTERNCKSARPQETIERYFLPMNLVHHSLNVHPLQGPSFELAHYDPFIETDHEVDLLIFALCIKLRETNFKEHGTFAPSNFVGTAGCLEFPQDSVVL
jgi:hypothetical protein